MENVQHSIRQGIWRTLKKISERIQVLWDARTDADDKVLLLFSVNGTKQYCGLAELSGPWEPNVSVEGWTDLSASFEG